MKNMEIDKIKNCWQEESKRISENVSINRGVSFQKFHTSFNRIKLWRFIRIIQWFVVMPVLFTMFIFPQMKNDGTPLFYASLVLFILIVLSFCGSYIYHYLYLSKIDFTEPISKVQQRIFRAEALDKKIYLYRFISMIIAFLCGFKILGSPTIGSEKMVTIGLFVFLMLYALIVRTKFLIPKEYTKAKSYLDEIEKEND